ncbi:hypothetical protein WOLCODRAFT_157358 [Wolfiporia cocos MD-104 SS10]|uniref:F-box domain-containing protein n=1 Tax=Wolfiporia cocos (strain MD-104) TaxID=742152 RepID=A0A2H3JIZ6_WOLCO|nr:hypothetical protein WOLCODRAFT_157358 [Wolfiporia cocos MD-104 SS10]
MAKANAAKRRTLEAAAASIIEDVQDHVDTAKATEGVGKGQQDPSSALREEAADPHSVTQDTRGKSVVKSEAEEESTESALESAEGAQEVKNADTGPGWRHIGRVPGAPAPTEGDPSSRRPLQLPTEVCERIIDWLWDSTWMLQRCALVCKAWTPRCRYHMQRHVFLYNRSHVQGHARRARAQPNLPQQASGGPFRSWAHSPSWARAGCHRLVVHGAIWKPSDFPPLIFFYLSAFSSLTALRLSDVTFPKVREFGRLVCALPSLVRLRCENLLFTSTAPCASLATTRSPPSVRLTDLAIFSVKETASNVEANKSLVEHLCAAGVVAHLQRFDLSVCASSDSKYLDVYREPLHKLLKQCGRSLHHLKLSLDARPDKDVEADAISDTIVSVFDLVHFGSLETVVLKALNFEMVGYAWMRRILEPYVSKNLREVSIVVDRPRYSENAKKNLQRTVSALGEDMCRQLNELFSNKDYEKLHHVDFVFSTDPTRVIPDATRWSSLLKAEMPKLNERGVLRTRVDVFIGLFDENYY